MTKTTSTAKTSTSAAAVQTGQDKAKSNVTNINEGKVSKIERAKELHGKYTAEGYQAPEGSSPRKEFIKDCVANLGMTEKGASTYWQNLNNEVKGEGRYKGAPAPTGAQRGRKADPSLKVKKAAAKVEKMKERHDETTRALLAASNELIAAQQEMVGAAS